MIVCHCHRVGDREITALARSVADTAPTADVLEDVQARCGAGTECGGCLPRVADLVATEVDGAARVA